MNENPELPKEVQIAHVHLQVSNLGHALSFYNGLLGLHEVKRDGETVYLSATGGPPNHIILTEIPDAIPQARQNAGLFHVAIRFPSRTALANVLLNLLEKQWPLQGASDHLVSEAIYLGDPDGLGIELYQDRPRETWNKINDGIEMATLPLDLQDLIEQADQKKGDYAIDPQTDIGHVHLQVSETAKAERFYHEALGLDMMTRSYPGALFMAAGGYHHHLGANTWNSRGGEPAPVNAVGLRSYAYQFPDESSLEAAQGRLEAKCYEVEQGAETSAMTKDEDGVGVELLVATS